MSRPLTPAARRFSLLLSLFQAEHSSARVPELVREMELTHSLFLSADLVRSDLTWLKEMGLIQYKADTAQLVERGRDVALRRAEFPG